MEYQIIKGFRHDGLIKEVNKWLAEGWQLYGSPYSDTQTNHFQAVIRKLDQ